MSFIISTSGTRKQDAAVLEIWFASYVYVNFVRDLAFLFLYWTVQQDGPIEIQNLAMPHLSRRAPVSNASPVCQSSKEEGYEKPKTS
jgi:hypothetical protein